jgi:small subunit ribosomal protein S6
MTETQEKKKISRYRKLKSIDKRGEPCYELTFLARPDVSHQDLQEFFKRIFGILADFNAKPVKLEYWGLRNLAYRIKKHKKAHFYSLQYHSNLAANEEISRIFKISDTVLRFLTLRTQYIDQTPSQFIINVPRDVENGVVVYDERYIVKI